MEVHALFERGWKISAIARHVGRDHNMVPAYLAGQRVPGQRASSVPDPLAPFEAYIWAWFADDHKIWATALYDEVMALGYDRSYRTFARQLRLRQLLPRCEACSRVRGRETIWIIRRGRRFSGTGSSGAGRRGAARPMSCWARCRTPAGFGA